MHKKTIDPVTGRMFMKHSIQDDLRDKRVREKAMVDRKVGQTTTLKDEKKDKMEKTRAKLVRDMSLDTTYAEYPSSLSREWQIAQSHLIAKNALTPDEKKDVYKNDPVDYDVAN